MRKRRSRAASNPSPIERLRLAIDCMPLATRSAMLDGLRVNERIIVGAYVDGQGGVCPMLAAHRRGGRTDFLSFARSWDRFTRSGGRSRRATARELRILIDQLEASLVEDSGLGFDSAIAEHRALVAAEQRRRSAQRAEAAQQAVRRLEDDSASRPERRRLPEHVDPSGWIGARRLPLAAGPRRRRDEQRAAERLLMRA